MKWKNEKQIAGILEEYFREKGYIPFRERWVAWRRADLVAVRLDEQEVYERIRSGFKIRSVHVFFSVLEVLEKERGMTLDELSRKTGYAVSYLKQVLGGIKLYVERLRDKVYLKREYRPYASEVVAIEIKLRNWRRGLVQAYDYLYGANKSYLAIPVEAYADIENEPKVIDWVKDKGVGILLVYPDKRIEEKIKARKQEPLSKRVELVLLETLWNKILEQHLEKHGDNNTQTTNNNN